MQKSKIRNMQEFSALTGLSRPTVSKYFHDPESVRASTRARIEAALAEHDFRPNIYAINQNRSLTKTVGIVVPYLADPFFAELARQIEQCCLERGYRPTLFSAHGDPKLETDILENLRSLKPAGVLLAPLGRASDRKTIEAFCADVPTVLFDSGIKGVGLAFIGSDSPQFADLMVDYLCRTGEPPCFFEMKTPSNPKANRRRAGYIAAMERLDHVPRIVSVPGTGWAFEDIGRREGIAAIDAQAFETGTVLCSNDRLAIGFISACFERGLSVGRENNRDMRVAGMDDHPLARFTCPPLTTVAQDYDAIARQSVDMLFRAVSGETVSHEVRQFDGRLVLRDSA
jgi:DNA-binding LacI/PurR family transcriptional regulator